MPQNITSEELRGVIEAGSLPHNLPESQLLALSDPDADALAIAGVRSAILYAANQLQHSDEPVRAGGEGRRLYGHELSLVGRAILLEASANLRQNEAVRVELGLTNEL